MECLSTNTTENNFCYEFVKYSYVIPYTSDEIEFILAARFATHCIVTEYIKKNHTIKPELCHDAFIESCYNNHDPSVAPMLFNLILVKFGTGEKSQRILKKGIFTAQQELNNSIATGLQEHLNFFY